MSLHLCVTVRFLDPCFHGRGDGGGAEWPPSPMRVFQSLIAAAARLGRGEPGESAASTFRWLEGLDSPPVIVAPKANPGSPYSLSVPNNAMDIAGRAWVRDPDTTAKEADPRTHRAMKGIRPMLLDGEAVHYVWAIPDGASGHIEVLTRTARSISALGWGIDMVIGQASILSAAEVERLAGERWLPTGHGGVDGLRVPVWSSYDALKARHKGFLARMGKEGFVAPPASTVYRNVEYGRATAPAKRPLAAFGILKPDGSGFRMFDAARKALTVAGMMRGTVKETARRSGWADSKIASFVLGHGEGGDAEESGRFAYIPLPSVEVRGDGSAQRIGGVRRVLLTSFSGAPRDEFAWARRNLSGQELFPEGLKEPAAMLALIPESDAMVQRYVRPAPEWATVTPVVLPGFDDPAHLRRRLEKERDAPQQKLLLGRLERRIDGLLRKAIMQAGFSSELARHAELEWRQSGHWAGVEMADRYGVPDHLKRFPRYHVRVRWRDSEHRAVAVRGPVCLGGGRFYGLGLFAARFDA